MRMEPEPWIAGNLQLFKAVLFEYLFDLEKHYVVHGKKPRGKSLGSPPFLLFPWTMQLRLPQRGGVATQTSPLIFTVTKAGSVGGLTLPLPNPPLWPRVYFPPHTAQSMRRVLVKTCVLSQSMSSNAQSPSRRGAW